jgi:hypothetical protein
VSSDAPVSSNGYRGIRTQHGLGAGVPRSRLAAVSGGGLARGGDGPTLGFIAGHEDALAVALLINAGSILKRNAERGRAQRAAEEAIHGCPGARGCPVLAYAAGMMAEAFVVRDALDPTTWAFVTEPWRTIVEIPPLYEGAEPELVAKARASRAMVENR